MAGEAGIRLTVFVVLFIALAVAEAKLPRRKRVEPKNRRWFTNLSIMVLDALTLRIMALVLPVLAVAAAADAQTNDWGLMNLVDLPLWLAIVLTILIFDFLIWVQHLVMHKVPVLWRLHRVHHTDRDLDVTSALRFHPLEIVLSMLIKIGAVYVLGPPVVGIILFEIILNGMAMFNHANLKLPIAVDRALRWIVVTPDMHRIHHSINRSEHDTNYGFSLSIWDRVFRTYVAEPDKGQEKMTVGLEWQDNRPSRLGWTLMLPFRHK